MSRVILNVYVKVFNSIKYHLDAVVITSGPCSIELPNAFTPNGDGLNDVFRLRDPALVKAFSLKVFNRWGGIVFETEGARRGWDGKLNGHLLDSGNFIWVLSYEDQSGKKGKLKGNVLLIR